ncbi:hypothetical protein [Sediminibacterium salmoneum]|uniref:hypothetical protein n=1 Tax=Sediminibacterium salmoneum TaxID=426421 RepID=UPI0004B5F9EC|nr:hypothetical protein [Sediminibacterium salmoneum]
MQMDDETFFAFWQENSEKEKSSRKAFMLGLSSGFAIGVVVITVILSGWYQRATMEANSKMSAFVLFMAILGLSVFIAFVYRKFKWEMNDQRYQEIAAKKRKIKNNDAAIQPGSAS